MTTSGSCIPLKQTGERGSGEWERISWDQALTEIGGRIRTAFEEDRHNEVMYHVGRPGEDGLRRPRVKGVGHRRTQQPHQHLLVERTHWLPELDGPRPPVERLCERRGHISHLVASRSGPLLQSARAANHRGPEQRRDRDLCRPAASNTGSKADHWLPTWPGTEAFLCLSIAHLLTRERELATRLRRRWVNWETFLAELYPDMPQTFDSVEAALKDHYSEYTPERAEYITGVSADQIREIAVIIGKHPTKFASHNWRAAGAGNEGGWQVARCLFFLNVLTGSVGTEGGTSGNGWNKFAAHQPKGAPPLPRWNELSWPQEFPLSYHEMSILLPHFLNEGRGKLDTYFSRVYNPIWTNPDGFTWLEALKDPREGQLPRRAHADVVRDILVRRLRLADGRGRRAHDVSSYETHAGRWIGFRQSVFRRYEEIKTGKPVSPKRRSHEFNPGEVWEEKRVLDRPVMEDRPRRFDGHPPMVRVRRTAGQPDQCRRVLRLHLRRRSPRPGRSCRVSWAGSARIHA